MPSWWPPVANMSDAVNHVPNMLMLSRKACLPYRGRATNQTLLCMHCMGTPPCNANQRANQCPGSSPANTPGEEWRTTKKLPNGCGIWPNAIDGKPLLLRSGVISWSSAAAGVALETMEPPSLGDFVGLDATLHGGAEAVEVRPGSRWNFRCRLPHHLTGP